MNRVAGTHLLYIVVLLGANDTSAQQLNQMVPATAACVELNRRIMVQNRNGDLAGAEAALTALAPGADRDQTSCRGFVLDNLAAALAGTGHIAEAEAVAKRSLEALEKIYPPDDPLLLRPLQILAATRFEQGNRAKAREALKKMQALRIERLEDSALVHGVAASLFQAEGRLSEAEAEDLAALHAWEKAGRGETADAASILNALGSLYIEEDRLDDASRTLDRALGILNRARDTVQMDRIRLLYLRGALHAKRSEWRESEQDFSLAISMADQEQTIDLAVLRPILTSYALVLRKNHRRKEAHTVEARAAAIGHDHVAENVVDMTDLMPKPKRVGKR